MIELVLIGGGGHCKSCIDVIEQERKYNVIGILDTPDKIGRKVLEYEIVGTDDDIGKFIERDCEFLITLGQIKSADLRKNIYEKIKSLNGKFANIISPKAYVSKHAKIEKGTIIMHGAFVNAGAVIGNNCIINTKSIIEHDCTVGNNCHIAIGAAIAGGVKVGDDSFIGANATIVQGTILPEKSFIKAGALVK